MSIGSITTEDALREFVRREIRTSDDATKVRTLQKQAATPAATADIADAAVTLAKLGFRLLYGTVNGANGAILTAGSGGWSSSRTSAGVYVVTYAPAFPAAPIVVPGLNTGGGATANSARASSSGTNGFTVETITTAAQVDSSWSFIVLGQR